MTRRSGRRHAGPRRVEVLGALALVGVATALVVARPADAATASFVAVADSYVSAKRPSANHATDPEIKAQASPLHNGYVKIVVKGIGRARVTSATLRLYSLSTDSRGVEISTTTTGWTERSITFRNAPPRGRARQRSGAVRAGTWATVDVTRFVTGDGTYSFGLSSSSPSGISLRSREGGKAARLTVVAVGAATPPPSPSPPSPSPVPSSPPPAFPVIAAAGDIAVDGTSGVATSDVIVADPSISAVLPLGDLAQGTGTDAEYLNWYDPTWGRFKSLSRPTPGNHDYLTPGAAAYYRYWNGIAPYYSFDLGGWHRISLNSQIPMGHGSAQEKWLRQDLAAHRSTCTLAYWHRPRFSSAWQGDQPDVEPLWQALYDYGADVVLGGHTHAYERFDALAPTGSRDPARGIRSWVVGTGGKQLISRWGPTRTGSLVRDNSQHAVLKLTLKPDGYAWTAVGVRGSVVDTGSAGCH